ncbi:MULTISPECIES: hypothetical protein [Myxococcaceae]|uniref:hypothetical protein n=1 Tax=Myxococcaceae TaxID=31 RepID=UPI00129C7ADC|nr:MULTISPECIES: hypothetical protein [Myxococcaceae]MBF5046447.1 hypothetical protein [Simulacricoccus sp. 17bor-14]
MSPTHAPTAPPTELERPTAEQIDAAVQLLVRTTPADAGGGWVHHAPEDGVLLRSQLDAAGRPQHQELHVLGEAFLWDRGEGVRTGRSEWRPGAVPHAVADPRVLPDRLAIAVRALAPYSGTDALLLNLRSELTQAQARVPRGASSTSYYPREGLVYLVIFLLFAVAFVVALVWAMGGQLSRAE